MGFISGLIDFTVYLLVKLKNLAFFLVEKAGELGSLVYRKYLEVGIFEKLIVFTTVGAFFAIVLPVARYYIFETWFYINNPLAVYMIAIVIVMLGSVFFNGKIKYGVRAAVNVYYLAWAIYLPLAGELTKAKPYLLAPGYYVNLTVPVVYLALASLSFFVTRE